MASDEEITHLRELLDIYRDRRRDIDKKVAWHGKGHLPAEIALDRQEVDESIARIEAKLRLASIPQDVQEATGPEAGLDVLRMHVKDMRDQFETFMRWVTAEIIELKTDNRSYRESRERRDEARDRREWALFVLVVLILVFVMWRLGP